MMYPVFVLLMMISLLLPAVPVAGCECGQSPDSSAQKSCCCSTSAADQKQKSCCCASAKQRDNKGTAETGQTRYQKQSCHCHRMVSQPAIIASVKSIELTEQLSSLSDFVVIAQCSLSEHDASALNFEKSPPVRSYATGEFCAHFCLWLI